MTSNSIYASIPLIEALKYLDSTCISVNIRTHVKDNSQFPLIGGIFNNIYIIIGDYYILMYTIILRVLLNCRVFLKHFNNLV